MPTGKLPSEGKKLFEKVYDGALKGSCKGDKECAARTAWSVVKKTWKEDKDGNWTKKSEIQEFSLEFKSLFVDEKTQTKRWRADTSDIDDDSHKDNMTPELFKSFMDRIELDEPAPEEFRSDFWGGGMPYMSISHYPDLNGKGVPGKVSSVYVDGRFLKAKGYFYDTPKGIAAWNALQEDARTKREDKTRISIGFLDYGHLHKLSGYKFERKSLDDWCPECLKEVITGERQGRSFFDGMLVHFALTRVPVNKRTNISPDNEMEVKSEMAITRKEDAASIIGEELAEELDELTKAEKLSEALVEFSETELEEEAKTKKDEEETPEDTDSEDTEDEQPMDKKKKKEMKSEADEEPSIEVDLAVTKKEGGCNHPSSHYLVVEDAKKPTTWHLRVKNCSGEVDHRLMGAAWAALHGGYRGNKYEGPGKSAAISKLKKLYSGQNMDTPTKADIELMELRAMIEEIKNDVEKEPEEVIVEQEQSEIEKSELYPAVKQLLDAFSEAKSSELPEEEKLKALQQPYAQLGEVIISSVRKPIVEEPKGEQSDLVKALSEVMTPIAQKLDLLLQSQTEKSEIPGRVPARRSINPAMAVPQLLKSEAEETNTAGKPIKISDFAKKSVY